MSRLLIIILLWSVMGCQTTQVITEEQDSTTYLSDGEVALANPTIVAEQTLFTEQTTLSVSTPVSEAWVTYTIDGSIPTQSDSRCLLLQTVELSGNYKFRAFHQAYQPSDVVDLYLTRLDSEPIEYHINSKQSPNKNYTAQGWTTLSDLRRGDSNFHKDWLGFQDGEIHLSLTLDVLTEINQVHVGLLSNQSAWIFLPQSVKVYHGDEVVGSAGIENSSVQSQMSMPMVSIPLDDIYTDQLTIVIQPLAGIPDWHDGAGTPPWTFIDEIIIQ